MEAYKKEHQPVLTLRKNPRMSERWKPSVTVAAVASRTAGGRTEYLLVEEETPEGLRLNNPAGHLDPGLRELLDLVVPRRENAI